MAARGDSRTRAAIRTASSPRRRALARHPLHANQTDVNPKPHAPVYKCHSKPVVVRPRPRPLCLEMRALRCFLFCVEART
eukprot:COSAG06_NODE_19380_length_841_cov_0.831536_1_plen_79_part_10